MRVLKSGCALILALGILFGLGRLAPFRPAQAAPAGALQPLIDAAPNGGALQVPAGTYHETYLYLPLILKPG